MDPELHFLESKEETIENLEAIQMSLTLSVEEGMIDVDATYYNELLSLIDEAGLSQTWDELEAVIAKGQTLETDVAAWLSLHGRTTLSLPWPKK